MMSLDTMFRRAAKIAAKYNWPEEAEQLAEGHVPPGFGREVGRIIALFKRDFPFGRAERKRDDEIARELSELRMYCAHLRMREVMSK
jgi:hypothetical protein